MFSYMCGTLNALKSNATAHFDEQKIPLFQM